MKFIDFYNRVLGCRSADDVFLYIINNLKPSNILWSYFVNWEKVFENVTRIEVQLNTLNYLIGKSDFETEFRTLVHENPQVVKALPALVVHSQAKSATFQILVNFKKRRFEYESFDFDKSDITAGDIEGYIRFLTETGIRELITSQKVKNLVDYVVGVEAGLDSNARKNRGGRAMEEIVEHFVADACRSCKCRYLREANGAKIKREFGIDIPVDKSSRRYDFVVARGNSLVLIEANFYGGGGSKLKATAGEYRNLYDVLRQEHQFVWITDGPGWKNTVNPLRMTFDHIEHVFSLSMLEQGILSEVFSTLGSHAST